MKALTIDTGKWGTLAQDRASWKQVVTSCLFSFEESRAKQSQAKGQEKKQTTSPSTFTCAICQRDCHSRIGFFSHR